MSEWYVFVCGRGEIEWVGALGGGDLGEREGGGGIYKLDVGVDVCTFVYTTTQCLCALLCALK